MPVVKPAGAKKKPEKRMQKAVPRLQAQNLVICADGTELVDPTATAAAGAAGDPDAAGAVTHQGTASAGLPESMAARVDGMEPGPGAAG